MINNIAKKLINQTIKIVTKLKKFNTLFTYNTKNMLNQNGSFSSKTHTHNFLQKKQIPESTEKLGDSEFEQFSLRDHMHEQYTKEALNIKTDQENIDGVSKEDLSVGVHKHNQYILKTKTNFSTASKLYDENSRNYIAPRVYFSDKDHTHTNLIQFGAKAKQAEGLYATSYKKEGNNIIQYTDILKPDKISRRGHKHDDIYITKSIADGTFMPKDFRIDYASGYHDGENKNKIKIYRYIPADTTVNKQVETFDTNILTTDYFEENIAVVEKGSIFGYIEEDKLHSAWRRNQIVNPEHWADFPGDLNKNLGISLTNLFGMKSIPGNNNTSYLLANMIMNEGKLDGVNLDDLYGKAASTQFIILFANSAVQKKLNEIGPKPIIEYTPDAQYVDVDVHTSMYKSFTESGKKQGSIKTTGANQYLYNATSRSKTSAWSTTQYKENTKNWIYGKKTTANRLVSSCNAASKIRNEIYSWYSATDKLYLRGLNKNEYYWYYDVPAQPDLGETANIFEYITETISLTVENYFKKIFDLFVVLLLSIDYFLCLGINYIFSLFDNLLVSIITPIMLLHLYINLALFKIDWMPAWGLISLFEQFVKRKPLVPIAKFAASNPMGTNIILLSKEVSTRFSTEWKRLIGHTPVLKTPYQMVNTLKILKDTPNSATIFLQPSGNFNLSKNYVQMLNSWTVNTGVPRYKGPHLLKNGELSYDIIKAKNKIDWKYIGFSAQSSGQEFVVNNYGIPFTLISIEEID